jgi:hypothetical protein
MLELRLALESWPMLVSEVTQRIVAWTVDADLIQRAVPEGQLGVDLLSGIERLKRGP